MKRSEMVEILKNEVNSSLSLRGSGGFDRYEASNILAVLEAAGMMPPLSDATIQSNPFNISDAILESAMIDFKWDEE